MKPKDALLKDNFPGVKAGKGRLSLAAIERCKELAAAGWDIDGYTVIKPTAAASKDTPPVVNKAKVAVSKEVVSIPDERYDAALYEVVLPDGTPHPIGMQGVCDICRNSLTYHFCDTPHLMHNGASVPVIIRAKAKK